MSCRSMSTAFNRRRATSVNVTAGSMTILIDFVSSVLPPATSATLYVPGRTCGPAPAPPPPRPLAKPQGNSGKWPIVGSGVGYPGIGPDPTGAAPAGAGGPPDGGPAAMLIGPPPPPP